MSADQTTLLRPSCHLHASLRYPKADSTLACHPKPPASNASETSSVRGRMWRSPRGVSTSCGMVPGEERHYLADPSWSQHWGEAVAAISAITFGKSTTGGDKYLATDTHDVEVSFTWCLK
ncbi:hypothetical protein M8818_000501 [Zalaria obscura]|uniref:Uncharacterized protein n=1 Tax=Zalaria obscura TaxID=2024903 RepID=A0ACC3SPS4_9PEZI